MNDSLIAKIYPGNNVINSNTVWTSDNGIIKIEAESFHPTGWEFANDWKGYSGEGYMINQVSYNSGKEEMSLKEASIIPIESQYGINFRVYEPGYYRMDAKWAADDSESNDLWFRFTEQDHEFHKIGRIIREKEKETFLFNAWNLKERFLEPGIHKAIFAPRSPGLCLDYLVVHKVKENAITDTTDFANEKYGYWLINAMSEKDKLLVHESMPAQVESNTFWIPSTLLKNLDTSIRIDLLPVDLTSEKPSKPLSLKIADYQ
ncbi:MAG: hypothetical protein K9G70_01465 [Prolixibacteraceae bacterium]|nr:hypothetical protein [Prolixibacteraceae bacterium]